MYRFPMERIRKRRRMFRLSFDRHQLFVGFMIGIVCVLASFFVIWITEHVARAMDWFANLIS